MTNLLNSRILAVTLEHLQRLRTASDVATPVLHGPDASGTWAGLSFAHPDVWAARGASKASGDVAVIPILGTITQRGSWFGTSLEGIRSQFRAKLADSGTKAIVLEFDSPGGEVFGVDELATEIRQARGTKPIVAFANPMAASAAMYLAVQADRLVVTPSGEVGSIGVYGMHVDMSRALDQMGVTVTLISAGEGKVDGNSFAPLADDVKAEIQSDVDRHYGMFVSAVAKGRRHAGATSEKIRGEWKAKMYGAKQAVEIGMADAVGTLDDAVRLAGSLLADRKAVAASVDVEVEAIQRARQRSA